MKRLVAMVGLLAFALPQTVCAQMPPMNRGAAAPNPRGITVTGSATTRLTATSARITLHLSSADRALILDAKSVAPVVDALVKAGADPASVQLPVNFSAPGASNLAQISATVEHPTLQQMQSGIVTVGTAIASMKDVVLNGATVSLKADDCSAQVAAVRRKAIENAHDKAAAIAGDLGVKIGSAVSVNSFETVAADGSCSSQYYINGMTGFNPQDPQGPDDYVTVPVSSSLTITYAIR